MRRRTFYQWLRNTERELGWWWDCNREGVFVCVTATSAVFGLIALLK